MDSKLKVIFLCGVILLGFPPSALSQKPLLSVATVGHKGHGKSTLTAALTKVLSKNGGPVITYDTINNPPSVKFGGITISEKTVEYSTQSRRYSHVDCQSNDDFVKYLLTGPPLDALIFVVSLSDGFSLDIKSQIELARKMKIENVIVYLSNARAVDDDELKELVTMEISEALTGAGYDDDKFKVIQGDSVAALNGDATWEATISDLTDALDSFPVPQTAAEKPFLFISESVAGNKILGKAESGSVRVGEEVELVGIRDTLKVKVDGILKNDQSTQEGHAGESFGIILHGIQKEKIIRVKPNASRM